MNHQYCNVIYEIIQTNTVTTNRQPALVASLASLIALTGFILFSINAPSPSISVSPIITITAQFDRTLITPYGPTAFFTIQAPEQIQPITNLTVTLEFSRRGWAVNLEKGTATKINETYNLTLGYWSVTKANPLLPSDSASQKISWPGYTGPEDNVTISGTYANGSAFRVKTYVNWIK
jgi:hypothetical protein